MKLLTLFALWGVTFFTMTPNVTQSISSRFSVASLFFSWDSRMSFLLAIFLSISAEDTRGFLDPVKAGKREHIYRHKWTIKTKQHFHGDTTSCCKTPLCLTSPWGHLKQNPSDEKASDDTGFCPKSCTATQPQACINSVHFRLTKNGWLSQEYCTGSGEDTVRIQSPLVATPSIGMVSGSWGFCVEQKLSQLELSWALHIATASLVHHWGYPRESRTNKIRAFVRKEQRWKQKHGAKTKVNVT